MGMIDPNQQKKFERDPEEGNIPTGMYLCELTEVRETGPPAKFPNGNPRLIFEFTVADPSKPALRGKKTVAFLGKTLLKSKEGRESNLVKWARMMGIANPEKGFDPDTLLHKKFNVMVEFTAGTNGEPGRGWARSAMLAEGQAGPAHHPPAQHQRAGQTGGPPADNADAPPPDEPVGGPDPNARWDFHDGKNWIANQSTADVQGHIVMGGLDASKVWVRPAGTKDSKRAHEYGFEDSPSPIPY